MHDLCDKVLRQRKLPHQVRRKSSSVFDPAHDSIKVMTLHVSKGLFYVGATRAMQRLVIGASGGGKFAARL